MDEWQKLAVTYKANVNHIMMWKYLVKNIKEQFAAKFKTERPVEITHELKCDKGHDLSKKNAFYCPECERKYYPRTEYNHFMGKDITKERAILDNHTIAFRWNMEGDVYLK